MRISIASSSIALAAIFLPSTFAAAIGSSDIANGAEGYRSVLDLAAEKEIDLSKIPAWEAVPALNLTPITTGAGLPTLQDLGLTWADLSKPMEPDTDEETKTSLTKRFTPYCVQALMPRNTVTACYNYLNTLGTTPCVTPDVGSIVMCSSGYIVWEAYSRTFPFPQTVTCANAARGGKWVMDNCGYVTNWIKEGANAAWGNGNFVVYVKFASWETG